MLFHRSVPRESSGARSRGARAAQGLIIGCAMLLMVCAAWLVLARAQSSPGGGSARQPPPDAAIRKTNNKIQMSETNVEHRKKEKATPFYAALDEALNRRGRRLRDVCALDDPVARRVLEDYGAMFLASEAVLPPPLCIFTSQQEVEKFQRTAGFTTARVRGDLIELQPAAMEALLEAREEARSLGLDITPRGGTEAARRSYTDTERLWGTRFLPALAHWQKLGRLSREDVSRLRRLPLHQQVREVLELEKNGIYFSKDFSKSILYSIAAPGTSQHIAMLALDVEQFLDERVRRILARHGWFQTVKSDLPHFTYLGLAEKDLPARGLRPVKSGGQLFWIPNVQ